MSGPPWRIAERWALLRNNCSCPRVYVPVCLRMFVRIFVLSISCITVSHPQMCVAGHGVSDCPRPREMLIPLKLMWQIKGRRWCNCDLIVKMEWMLDGFGGHSVGQARSVHLRDGQYDILYHTVVIFAENPTTKWFIGPGPFGGWSVITGTIWNMCRIPY